MTFDTGDNEIIMALIFVDSGQHRCSQLSVVMLKNN